MINLHFTKKYFLDGLIQMSAKIKPIQFNDEKPKDELFALIKSLSQNEKRYVKMFSAHGNSDLLYLQLFDAMEAEDFYDEKGFVQKHAGKPFIRNLAPVKRFLKLSILRAMRSYHEERYLRQEVQAHLQNFHFLYEKGLYTSAQKQLNSAKKKATEGELNLLLLEINQQENGLLIELSDKASKLPDKIASLQREQKVVLERLQLNYLFSNTYYKLFVEYRRGHSKALIELIEPRLLELDSESLLVDPELKSFESQLSVLNIKAFVAEDNKQFNEAKLVYSRILQLFRTYNRDHGEHLSRYLRAINNYLNHCHQTQDYSEYEDLLSLLRNLLKTCKIPDQKGEILQALCLFEGVFYLNTHQWNLAKGIPIKVRTLFEQYGQKVNKSREITLAFNCMIIWFIHEKWDKMKPWMEHLQQADKTGFRKNATHAAKVLELVYHYERHNHELIPYIKRSLERKIQFPIHKDLLKRLYKINNAPILERSQGMRELAHFLQSSLSSPTTGMPLAGLSEMYFWAQARARGISIVRALEEVPPPASSA